MKFSTRITLLLVGGLFTLSAVGLTIERTITTNNEERVFEQLTALRDIKKTQVQDYFEQIEDQVVTFSRDQMIVDAMIEFKAAFHTMTDEIPPEDLAMMEQKVRGYYELDFLTRYKERHGAPIDIQPLLPSSPQTIYAQYNYIANNPNPLGSKELLDRAGDTPYDQLHNKYHPIIRDYLQRFGYYDIFLIDPQTGEIVYSVFKELDYATSLIHGPYAKSNFGQLFQEILKSSSRDNVRLVDFAAYTPSYEDEAAFIASPIYDGSQLEGILIFQMPVDRLNRLMQQSTGMGETGETYLVGSDRVMRSQSRFIEESTILVQEVATDAVAVALTGSSGTAIIDDYRGTSVLSSYAPIKLLNLDWIIIAEQDEAEAFASLSHLRSILGVIMFGAVVLILLVAAAAIRSTREAFASVQKTAEENLVLAEEAKKATAMKSDFLATMSHELRTPLNAIIGFNKLAVKRANKVAGLVDTGHPAYQAVQQQEKYLTHVTTAADGLLTLINQILDLSKIEAGRMEVFVEEVKVLSIVSELQKTTEPLIKTNNNRLVVQAPDTIGNMRTDVTKVQQILLNLVGNAAKFTQNGTVTLSVAPELSIEKDFIVFTVQDTGIGMTPEQQTKIFDSFTQADTSTTRQFGGTGMGLAIVKNMIELLKGTISVESTMHAGSTFTVRIPRNYSASSTAAA